MPQYYLYILDCAGDRWYTGITTNWLRRMQQHRRGSAQAKFTRAFPVRRCLVYWRLKGSLSQVMRLERKVKNLPKAAKRQLVAQPDQLEALIDNSC